jgi:membrane-associated phospholipid phosphatase
VNRTWTICLLVGVLIAPAALAGDKATTATPRAEPWLAPSLADYKVPAPAGDASAELAAVRLAVARRGAADVERIRWWDTGGPVYRWNEIAVGEMLDQFATLPIAARHLAVVQTAVDDAVAAAWAGKQTHRRPRPAALDAKLATAVPTPQSPSYPSDYAAAAAAASEVLAHLFPARAAAFAQMAEEAMQARIAAGVEFPGDREAGRTLGRQAAALAIARANADGSDAKWTGSVPQGPGKWQGTNPIAPMAGTWKTWVLSRPDELRPPAPPAHDSEQIKADLRELKQFPRMPKTNHRATYWEVFGGARAHALWNDVARTKLLEHGAQFDAQAQARVLAAVNVALIDAGIACWDAKFTYWYIRPPQLDPELKTVVPPPNHPSYPAAHGCFSTAAATVLAAVFPRDVDRLSAQGREAAEARVWAGIHYRTDIEAGQTLGRQVAERVLSRSFVFRAP